MVHRDPPTKRDPPRSCTRVSDARPRPGTEHPVEVDGDAVWPVTGLEPVRRETDPRMRHGDPTWPPVWVERADSWTVGDRRIGWARLATPGREAGATALATAPRPRPQAVRSARRSIAATSVALRGFRGLGGSAFALRRSAAAALGARPRSSASACSPASRFEALRFAPFGVDAVRPRAAAATAASCSTRSRSRRSASAAASASAARCRSASSSASRFGAPLDFARRRSRSASAAAARAASTSAHAFGSRRSASAARSRSTLGFALRSTRSASAASFTLGASARSPLGDLEPLRAAAIAAASGSRLLTRGVIATPRHQSSARSSGWAAGLTGACALTSNSLPSATRMNRTGVPHSMSFWSA